MAESFRKFSSNDVIELEGLISEVSSTSKVLNIVFEDARDSVKGELLAFLNKQAPVTGLYHIFLLTDDQLDALRYTIAQVGHLSHKLTEEWDNRLSKAPWMKSGAASD